MENLKFNATVKRETEKALLLDVEVDTQAGRKGRQIWFPKSQIVSKNKSTYEFPGWLVRVKEEELGSNVYGILLVS